MALHIKDPETEGVVRRLAERRGATLTETIKQACSEAMERELRARPLAERLAEVYALVDKARPTGKIADKAFFDRLWGEPE